MTDTINKILSANNLVGANVPIGWWQYSLPNEPKPKILKYCALYESTGDKRLSDHVLVGLERLLKYFVPHLDVPLLLSKFPRDRVQDDGSVTETWITALTTDNEKGTISVKEILPQWKLET
jgi:hypothetical protein